MRYALVLILAAATVLVAVFLSVAHLKMHGHYRCAAPSLSGCDPARSYWVVGRYVWQIPVAIVIAAVGLGGAAALARRPKRPRP